MSLNGYSYVENNPIMLTDPSGLSSCACSKCDEVLNQQIEVFEYSSDVIKQVLDSANIPVDEMQVLRYTNSTTRYASYLDCLRTCVDPRVENVPSDSVFVVGLRFDFTFGLPNQYLANSIDVNAEFQCAPKYTFSRNRDTCGWFANMSIEYASTPTINFSLGFLLGVVGWPNDAGEYSVVYAAGVSLPTYEADITIAPGGGILYIGRGAAISNWGVKPIPVAGFISTGVSLYLGPDLQNIPPQVWEILPEIGEMILPLAE